LIYRAVIENMRRRAGACSHRKNNGIFAIFKIYAGTINNIFGKTSIRTAGASVTPYGFVRVIFVLSRPTNPNLLFQSNKKISLFGRFFYWKITW